MTEGRAVTEGRSDLWDGGWDAHRRAQLRAWASTTPEQRLAWLETAIEFVREAQRAQKH